VSDSYLAAYRYIFEYITKKFPFMRKIVLLFVGVAAAFTAIAQDTAAYHPLTLGQVVVVSGKPSLVGTTIHTQQFQQFSQTDISHALDLLPGVSLTAVGPRNESAVYVRGFDLRSTTLLLDGIPIYEPYDGYVDMGRFTTFDLAEITVSKDYTSLLYGPNAVGGAIWARSGSSSPARKSRHEIVSR